MENKARARILKRNYRSEPIASCRRQLHKDLLAQHPEWIDADGNCPTCDDYERRFARLISIFKSQSKKSQRKERNET